MSAQALWLWLWFWLGSKANRVDLPQVVCELEANKWTPSGQAGGDVVTARSCRPERRALNRAVQIKNQVGETRRANGWYAGTEIKQEDRRAIYLYTESRTMGWLCFLAVLEPCQAGLGAVGVGSRTRNSMMLEDGGRKV